MKYNREIRVCRRYHHKAVCLKAILLILLVICASSCEQQSTRRTGLEGQPLPSFSLLLPDSVSHFNTKSIPSGQPVVLFDFGPDCPYSKAQIQEIIGAMSKLKNIQFLLLTVSPFRDMKNFSDKYQLYKYKNITTGVDYNDFFGSYFKSTAVPGLAIYGKNKRLNGLFIGKTSVKQIIRIAEQ